MMKLKMMIMKKIWIKKIQKQMKMTRMKNILQNQASLISFSQLEVKKMRKICLKMMKIGKLVLMSKILKMKMIQLAAILIRMKKRKMRKRMTKMKMRRKKGLKRIKRFQRKKARKLQRRKTISFQRKKARRRVIVKKFRKKIMC